ncbi:hypothetical protein [Marininema halotolerans]|uniref:Uncharacterized protein n=1 Tax=Marininema halotolerans TaxID=1155944 RepID=A0A1I6QK37_9BACL|nr:hypothetical protein [Marininema halotolerans]SFS52847.1 hypothetical protein SAMN05444972_103204 [Marininema halotolerans]
MDRDYYEKIHNISNEKKEEIKVWLKRHIFPEDSLEDQYFQTNKVLYQLNFNTFYNPMEAIIHNHHPAPFSSKELNDAIRQACIDLELIEGCHFFKVIVHDGFGSMTDTVGHYSLKRCGSFPLSPLYQHLNEDIVNGGEAGCTGLLGVNKDWMLTIEDGGEITFRIHGTPEFCDRVTRSISGKITESEI